METYYQNEITLAEKVAKPISNDCPYTLFLGAGASVSSGIPSAKKMIRNWQELLYKEQRNLSRIIDEDFENWLKHEYPEWRNEKGSQYAESDYSLLFGHFYQQPKERQLYIEREMEGKKPTFGYLYLAGLIAANRFNRILTSNFDDLLHDALMKYYDIKPIVCAFDSAVSGIRVTSQRPKIIKLHGDFLFDNIRNMRHELKGLDTNMEEKMYEMCKDAGLIVVGYSGSDEAVMAPIRDMIRKPDYLNMGVHWCIHKPKDGNGEGSELPPKLQELKNYHGDRIHIYYIESFDRLVEEMFIACNCELPKVLTDPHRNNLPKEFYNSVIEGSSAELTTFMKENLELFASRAVSQTGTLDNKLFHADAIYQRGKDAREKGKITDAKQRFQESYNIIEEILKAEQESEELYIKALRRKSGVCIALSKIHRGENDEKWEEFLKGAMDTINQGLKLMDSPIGHLLAGTLKATFHRNACCVISLFAEYNQKKVSKEDKNQIFEHLKATRKSDYEGIALMNILNDSDFEYCYNILKKEIDSTFFH